MVLRQDCIEISKNGGYYDPESIGWFGLMSKFRVGDLLPYDYSYKEKKINKKIFVRIVIYLPKDSPILKYNSQSSFPFATSTPTNFD